MPAPNRIILGCMNFGPEGSATTVRVTSMDEFKACLEEFKSRGYDELDTARAYTGGKQENWTAQAGGVKNFKKIATKVYPVNQGTDFLPENLRKSIDTSLAELGVDSIDLFYLHAADRSLPFEVPLEVVNEYHQAGKIKELGLSNYTASEVSEVAMICKYRGWLRPSVYQGPYNCINRTSERDLIPTLRRFGIEYVVYNPIAGGMLTDKFVDNLIKDKDHVPSEGRFSDQIGPAGKAYRGKYFHEQMFQALRDIKTAASKHGIPMSHVGFRWCVHHSQLNMPISGKGNDAVLFGASSLAQLKENLDGAEGGPLPQDVLDACEAAWASIAGVQPVYYHGTYEYKYDTEKAIYGA